MKKVLTDAPLVQALIDLRFSEIPSLTNVKPDLLFRIHEVMIFSGFAEKIESKGQSISINFDQATQQATHEVAHINRYLFRSAGERSIVEISKNGIIYKSTDYDTFEHFYKTFSSVLESLSGLIPELKNSLLKRVGLRYIDVIVPDTGNKLTDFVSNQILPADLSSQIQSYKHLHGLTSKSLGITENQTLRIAFEELRVELNTIKKILPDELVEPDKKCGLLIQGQKSWAYTDSPTYGILDIDHTYQFAASPLFSIDAINNAANDLYNQSKEVFWGLVTKQALEKWGFKEIENVE